MFLSVAEVNATGISANTFCCTAPVRPLVSGLN
jgi:hypothetical protein